MIDDKIIKQNYVQMSDAELLNLAQTEGSLLTPSALLMLYQEFNNRSLDTSIFVHEADNIISIKTPDYKNENSYDNQNLMETVWIYVFKEKENNKSNNEIFNGLLQRGFNEARASVIILNIETKTLETLAALNKNVLRGAIISLLGIGSCIYTYSAFTFSTIYILSWGAIVIGIFLLFKGVTSKSRYKTILANIETERILLAEASLNIEIISTEPVKEITPPPGTG